MVKSIVSFLAVLILFLAGPVYSLNGKILSEMLQSEFSKRHAFNLIERRKLDQVMKEQSLEMAGIIDNQASKLGQLVGADKIITGSLMKVDNKYVLLVKMVDVTTGQVDMTEGIKVNDESKLEKGIRSIVTRIVKQGQSRWGSGLASKNVAISELEDMREENKPEYQNYIIKVNPTIQKMPESYRASLILSVDVLSLFAKGLFLDYEFAFNKFGVGLLLNLSIPVPGSFLVSFGMDMKYYPFKVGRILNPYLGLGYMFTFAPYTMPVLGSAGIRIHPIPGFDKIFIDAGGGVMVDVLTPLLGSILGSSGDGVKFLPYITAKVGWKF